jgi:hypothetical protein
MDFIAHAMRHFFVQKVARDYCSLCLRFERQSRSFIPNGPVFRWVPGAGATHSLSAIFTQAEAARVTIY